MCAWRAAPFLWQKDSFSCRDAHAFNRNSSSQVAVNVGPVDLPLVSLGFSPVSSPAFPSSHEALLPLRFRFVTHNSLARFWELVGAPKR
jgi:hypothetical protein